MKMQGSTIALAAADGGEGGHNVTKKTSTTVDSERSFKEWLFMASAAGAGMAVGGATVSLLNAVIDKGVDSAVGAIGGGAAAGGAFGF